jgi:hypothetical protein
MGAGTSNVAPQGMVSPLGHGSGNER